MVLKKDTALKFPHLLVIDASAGSGKTHTLTQRYVQFILSRAVARHHSDLVNILAITFTNNTAREMKQRIIGWLKKCAFDTDSVEKQQTLDLITMESEQLVKKAGQALEMIIDRYSDFHVQTIDSFMNRILRSSADELGIPPDHDITDSYTKLVEETVNTMLSMTGIDIPYRAIDDFLELLNQFSSTYIWNPSSYIKKQFELFLKQEGKVLEEIQFPDQGQAKKRKYEELYGLYEQVKGFGYTEDDLYVDAVRSFEHKDHVRFDLNRFFKGYRAENAWIKYGAKRMLSSREGQELASRIRTAVSEITDIISLEQYASYGSLYRHFKTLLEKVKRRKALLHFDDINKKLVRYIDQGIIPDIYCRLGDRLYHFLLDEFQDTDRVQWQNAMLLLDEAFAKGGTLFAVGDLKQAIYQFRKADYRIMRHVIRCITGAEHEQCLSPSLTGSMELKSLDENHRSDGVILDYVDLLFKDRLKKQVGTELLPEDRTGLTGYRQRVEPAKAGLGYVRTVVIKETEEREEKQVLLDIVKDAGQRHALKDIAVLTYANWGVEEIVAWLTEARINAASYSSLSIKKRKIVMEIIGLLQFLDSPVDNLKFAEFITGDIFSRAVQGSHGKTATDRIRDMLVEKTLSGDDTYFYTWLREHDDFRGLWDLYFERLYKIVGYYPLYDLVIEVYRTFRVLENFPDETGFLVRFLEAIVTLEGQGMNDIKQFAELVAEEGQENILNIMLPDYLDAVKVMTFHKAKGLGFPVVVNLFSDKGGFSDCMYFDREGENLLVRYINKKMQEHSPRLTKVYYESTLDERIQELNVQYVALTRAKNELYNIVVRAIEDVSVDEPGGSAASEVKKEKEKGKRKTKAKAKVEELGPLDLFETCEYGKKAAAAGPKAALPPAQPVSVILPKRGGFEFTQYQEKGWTVGRRQDTGKGDLIHAVLAEIEYFDERTEKSLPDLVKDVLCRGPEKYDQSEFSNAIRIFLNMPGVKPWFENAEGRAVQREAEFVGPDGSLCRMDRVVIDRDSVTLIDFKTGDRGEKLGYYEKQLRDYGSLLKAVHAGKSIRLLLAFVDTGRVEEVA
ncbi:MAG TPA: UvrD-helicase domain-containing protein [bacterium]